MREPTGAQTTETTRRAAWGGALGRAVLGGWDWLMRRRVGGPVGPVGLPIIVGVTLGAAGAAFPPTRDAAYSVYDSMRHAVLSRPEYQIRWVVVSGAPRISDAEVVAALDLKPEERAALGFDANEARRRVESLGWVKSAAVLVRPPQTLEIRIVEREPAALWRRGDRLAILDRQGVMIDTIPDRAAWPELPLVVGPKAQGALGEGLALRDEAEAAGLSVAALTRVGGRRWDMDLDGGPRVMLPERDPFSALRDVISWTAHADLLRRGYEVIDLRIPFAPSARPRSDAAPDLLTGDASG